MLENLDPRKLYQRWLSKQLRRIDTLRTNEWIVAMPLEDRHGSVVQAFIRRLGPVWIVSDRRATFETLMIASLPLTNHFRHIIDVTLQDFRVSWRNCEIVTTEYRDTHLGAAVQRVIQCSLAIQHLAYTFHPPTTYQINEPVADFFRDKGISVQRDIVMDGKAGSHRFDFAFARHDQRALVRVLSTDMKSDARRLAMETALAFIDVHKSSHKLFGIAVIADSHASHVWRGETLNILNTYSDLVVPWSEREQKMSAILPRWKGIV